MTTHPEQEEEQGAVKMPQKGKRSLSALAARGTLWTVLGYGGSQALRFIGNLILTRLLFEEAFGVMALVWVFLQGLALFSDIGIGPSIIQNKRGEEPSFLNTAWTIQVGRGLVLWLIACAGAVPFASFYGEPMLSKVLPVAGLAALFSGFFSTKLFTMNRRLTVGRIALIELVSQIVGLVVMVAWALIDRSVWALVAGGVTSPLIKLILSHLALSGERNRLHWNRDDARELIRFGRWIFLSTAMTFLATQSDRLIFGKLIPLAMLGVYHIAITLASIPIQALEQLGSKIIFPLFSRVFNEGGDLGATFLRVRLTVLALSGWGLAGFIAGGTTIIDILYDDRYAEAGWIVQMLSIGSWICVIDVTYKSVLLAKGKANIIAAANLGKLLGMVALIPLGFHYYQFPGAVVGLVGAELFRLAVSSISSRRLGVSGWSQDLGLTTLVVVSGAMGWYSDGLASNAGVHVLLRALLVFVVVSTAWSPFGVYFYRRFKREGSPLK